MRRTRTARRAGGGLAGFVLAGAAAVALPGAAGAAPLPDNCTSYTPPLAATRVTCEFDYTGAAQSFHVPDGVSELDVTAVGGHGGSNDEYGDGGAAATVTGTVDVDPGADLGVYVGGDGGADAGGFNGGGSAGGISGSGGAGSGGGGASDVRSGTGLDTRLIVAAGGGGNGRYNDGGGAGQAGHGTGAGQPGTQTAGGAGGGELNAGGDGTLGVGGDGGYYNGGAGGGGLYGGGGGGNSEPDKDYDGGGAGGSSLVPAGGTVALAGDDETPSVTISYTICTGSVCRLAGSLGNLFGS